jgi:oligopeptide transport system ATP-binding protein
LVHAVDGVDFTVENGETFALVGETGCGKTTLGRLILRLIEPTDGEIYFQNTPISEMEEKRLRRNIQMVFQDPYSSLNPAMRVEDLIGRPLEIHGLAKGEEKKKQVLGLLDKVGLKTEHTDRYPSAFSGGQRQRIAIARALSVSPNLVVMDEPTAALDVSIQAQILNLLKSLQEEFGLTYMLISHDLAVVENISHHVAVMYLGQIVELTMTDELFESPFHPYTKALLSAHPGFDVGEKENRIILRGPVASPITPPSGCRFHTRCPHRKKICVEIEPDSTDVGQGHYVSCHLFD